MPRDPKLYAIIYFESERTRTIYMCIIMFNMHMWCITEKLLVRGDLRASIMPTDRCAAWGRRYKNGIWWMAHIYSDERAMIAASAAKIDCGGTWHWSRGHNFRYSALVCTERLCLHDAIPRSILINLGLMGLLDAVGNKLRSSSHILVYQKHIFSHYPS